MERISGYMGSLLYALMEITSQDLLNIISISSDFPEA
jgi:hypothetical protein